MPRTSSVFRKRWPFLAAAAVVLAVAVAAGSMFAANSGEPPVQEAAAAPAQPDLTDPGLYADPSTLANAIAEPREPRVPAAPHAVAPPAPDAQDPGVNQVVPEGSGALASWLAERPANMGSFSAQDAIIATELDVEWMLYQAVEKGEMTEDEADAFRTWFDQRPNAEEAPELLNHLPPEIQMPGGDGFSGTDIGSLKSR
ncbi:MAG: hypothetical protein OXL37_11930 [Chloroflexota bacterium]|nr:hypothetical protein [Chloroflexota bacterium]MDE2962150.1 hypothetical protein [Chloroflexota bacterium]